MQRDNSLHGQTVVLTGVTGLIGKALAFDLSKRGCKLILPVRDIRKAEDMLAQIKEKVLLEHDFSLCEELQIADNVDYIVHAASPTSSQFMVNSPVETITTIVNGTRTMLELAKQKQVKGMVYLSSMEVYGKITDDSKSVSECVQGYIDPLNARSSYPMAKRMAESLCFSYYKEYSVPVRIARLVQTFGPGVDLRNDNRVFAQFVRSAKDGKNIMLATTGGTKRMYLHISDAISALNCLLEKGQDGEAYNVANEDTYISIKEMAELVRSRYNNHIKVETEYLTTNYYLDEIHLRLSTQKLRQLGWIPKYSLEKMFDDLISYSEL